ncbi:MAG TPA: hypothetical protein VIJ33_06765 [Solirubrobacteraceae bacterium]
MQNFAIAALTLARLPVENAVQMPWRSPAAPPPICDESAAYSLWQVVPAAFSAADSAAETLVELAGEVLAVGAVLAVGPVLPVDVLAGGVVFFGVVDVLGLEGGVFAGPLDPPHAATRRTLATATAASEWSLVIMSPPFHESSGCLSLDSAQSTPRRGVCAGFAPIIDSLAGPRGSAACVANRSAVAITPTTLVVPPKAFGQGADLIYELLSSRRGAV